MNLCFLLLGLLFAVSCLCDAAEWPAGNVKMRRELMGRTTAAAVAKVERAAGSQTKLVPTHPNVGQSDEKKTNAPGKEAQTQDSQATVSMPQAAKYRPTEDVKSIVLQSALRDLSFKCQVPMKALMNSPVRIEIQYKEECAVALWTAADLFTFTGGVMVGDPRYLTVHPSVNMLGTAMLTGLVHSDTVSLFPRNPLEDPSVYTREPWMKDPHSYTKMLVDSLRMAQSPELSLFLVNAFITDDFIEHFLVDYLKERKVTRLDLSENPMITDRGFRILAQALGKTSIVRLRIKDLYLESGESLEFFSRHARGNLEMLDLTLLHVAEGYADGLYALAKNMGAKFAACGDRHSAAASGSGGDRNNDKQTAEPTWEAKWNVAAPKAISGEPIQAIEGRQRSSKKAGKGNKKRTKPTGEEELSAFLDSIAKSGIQPKDHGLPQGKCIELKVLRLPGLAHGNLGLHKTKNGISLESSDSEGQLLGTELISRLVTSSSALKTLDISHCAVCNRDWAAELVRTLPDSEIVGLLLAEWRNYPEMSKDLFVAWQEALTKTAKDSLERKRIVEFLSRLQLLDVSVSQFKRTDGSAGVPSSATTGVDALIYSLSSMPRLEQLLVNFPKDLIDDETTAKLLKNLHHRTRVNMLCMGNALGSIDVYKKFDVREKMGTAVKRNSGFVIGKQSLASMRAFLEKPSFHRMYFNPASPVNIPNFSAQNLPPRLANPPALGFLDFSVASFESGEIMREWFQLILGPKSPMKGLVIRDLCEDSLFEIMRGLQTAPQLQTLILHLQADCIMEELSTLEDIAELHSVRSMKLKEAVASVMREEGSVPESDDIIAYGNALGKLKSNALLRSVQVAISKSGRRNLHLDSVVGSQRRGLMQKKSKKAKKKGKVSGETANEDSKAEEEEELEEEKPAEKKEEDREVHPSTVVSPTTEAPVTAEQGSPTTSLPPAFKGPYMGYSNIAEALETVFVNSPKLYTLQITLDGASAALKAPIFEKFVAAKTRKGLKIMDVKISVATSTPPSQLFTSEQFNENETQRRERLRKEEIDLEHQRVKALKEHKQRSEKVLNAMSKIKVDDNSGRDMLYKYFMTPTGFMDYGDFLMQQSTST